MAKKKRTHSGKYSIGNYVYRPSSRDVARITKIREILTEENSLTGGRMNYSTIIYSTDGGFEFDERVVDDEVYVRTCPEDVKEAMRQSKIDFIEKTIEGYHRSIKEYEENIQGFNKRITELTKKLEEVKNGK